MNNQELNASLKKLTAKVSYLLEAGKEDQALSVMNKGLAAYRGVSNKWWVPDLFPLLEVCDRYDHQGKGLVYDEKGEILRGTERSKDGKVLQQGERKMFMTDALIKKSVEVFGADRAYEKLSRRGHLDSRIYYFQCEMSQYPEGVISLRKRMKFDQRVQKIAEQIVEGHFSKVPHPDGRRVKKDGVTKPQIVGCVDSVLDELADRMKSICKGNDQFTTDCGKIQKAEYLMGKTFEAVGKKLKEYGSVIVEPNMEKLASVCVEKKVDIKRLYEAGAEALGKGAFDGLRKYHGRYDSPLKQVTDYIHSNLVHSSRHNDAHARIVASGGKGGR